MDAKQSDPKSDAFVEENESQPKIAPPLETTLVTKEKMPELPRHPTIEKAAPKDEGAQELPPPRPSLAAVHSKPGNDKGVTSSLVCNSHSSSISSNRVTKAPVVVTNANAVGNFKAGVVKTAVVRPTVTTTATGSGGGVVAKRGRGRKASDSTHAGKKRKASRPAQRVLYAKKESQQATALLHDKGDLSNVLNERECFFLAEKVWIFTTQQLRSIIDSLLQDSSISTVPEDLREDFVAKLNDFLKPSSAKPISDNENKTNTEVKDLASDPRPAQTLDIQAKGGTVGKGSPPPSAKAVEDRMDVSEEISDRKSASKEVTTAAPTHTSGTEQQTGLFSLEVKEKLRHWKEVIEKNSSKMKTEDKFRLDGPIKTLFPLATRNFLKSMKVETLWNYLALKRTETGLVCERMAVWRQICGLPKVSDIGLVRHFFSVATRVERALAALPFVDPTNRKWLSDPINSMTGAAREFLVFNQHIYSAAKLLAMQTKHISTALVTWRATKGMEPLKGSGKVAMVSSWKTAAKESLESESQPGKVIEMPPPQEVYAEKTENARIMKKNKADMKQPSRSSRGSDYALHSELFLSDVLGQTVANVVSSAGIKTAASMFEAVKKSTGALYRVLIENKLVTDEVSFRNLVGSWSAELRKELCDLKPKQLSTESRPANSTDTLPPSPKLEQTVRVTTNPTHLPTGTRDPIEALSTLTREFLQSTGINTAHELLTSRTTDISVSFKAWRVSAGMPELKGLGAVASVSGWKTTVRKLAKELGLGQVALLEPSTRGVFEAETAINRTKVTAPTIRDRESKISNTTITDFQEELSLLSNFTLKTNGRQLLAVQKNASSTIFVFEITRRTFKAENETKEDLFVTYMGCGPRPVAVDLDTAHERKTETIEGVTPSDSKQSVNVLSNVRVELDSRARNSFVDTRTPYSMSDTGNGLINVSAASVDLVKPTKKQNLRNLKRFVDDFVHFGLAAQLGFPVQTPDKMCNVVIQKEKFNQCRYLLSLTHPIEKGQTTCLEFPTIEAALFSPQFRNTQFRLMHALDMAFQTLCLEDMREILEWLVGHVLKHIELSKPVRDGPSATLPLPAIYECRERLHWVSRRLFSAMGKSRLGQTDMVAFNVLAVSPHPREINRQGEKLSTKELLELQSCISNQIKLELHCYLELDQRRKSTIISQTAIASQHLNSAIDAAASSYCAEHNSAVSQLEELAFFLKKEISMLDFSDPNKLDMFVQRIPAEVQHEQSEVFANFMQEIKQEYNDAIATCSESGHPIANPDGIETVVCFGESSDGLRSFKTQRLHDVQSGLAKISASWYRSMLWQISFSVLSALCVLLENDAVYNKLEEIRRSLFVVHNSVIDEPRPISYGSTLLPCFDKKASYIPSSFQFFLGTVWPDLRRSGWRMCAGASPSDISFTPKARKTSGRRNYIRDQKRMGVEATLDEMGMKNISKIQKRLCISVVQGRESDDCQMIDLEKCEYHSVNDVLQGFRTLYTLDNSEVSESTSLAVISNIDSVLECLRDCFDFLAPTLFPLRGIAHPVIAPAGQRACDAYRAEYLIQFLVLLPETFRHTEMAVQETNDILDVVKSLSSFVSRNYEKYFHNGFHPTHEEYVYGCHESSVSKVPVDPIISMSSSSHTGLFEMIPNNQKSLLTDLVLDIMAQSEVFYASEIDVEKKHGRVAIGFPGLLCRHCKGSHNGRYFFSSPESLTSAYPVLEKHFLKCPAVPVRIKQRLMATRLQHSAQLKQHVPGSQQMYFTSLWERLRNSAGLPPSENLAQKQQLQKQQIRNQEFTDHVSFLNYLRSPESTIEMKETLDLYYSCLEYTGRIYNTAAMPNHFSAEWLLRKVQPKTNDGRNARNIGSG